MKNLAILLIAICLFSCKKDDDENLITEEGIIYYDEAAADNCELKFKNNANAFYSIPSIENEFKENQLKVSITYKITEDRMNCGFGTYLNTIDIKSIKKVSNN